MPHPDLSPLTDVAWLMQRLDAPDIRIIDASWALPGTGRDMRLEHTHKRIPGAVFFDIDEIADLTSPLPHMAPPPEKFASRMRRMGIGDGARVIVYDNSGIFSAARVWWLFRLMGKADVSVLDGGLPAWEAAGGPLDDGPAPKPQERHFTARFRGDLIRGRAEMQALVAAGGRAIVDVRPAGRFAGVDPEPRPGLRGGHMPGAANIPYTALVTEDGRLGAPEHLRAIFEAAGVRPEARPVLTCGSGVTAAIGLLALARLGVWDAALYDGSWAEWGADPALPVATGRP